MGINLIAVATWHESHTDLSKFLLGRLNQLVDEEEGICNRYSVTNGLILLEELCSTAALCLERWKNNHRLQSLLDECCDDTIGTSVISDPIIHRYFRGTSAELTRLQEKPLTPALARTIHDRCLVHLAAICPAYINLIRQELSAIDLASVHFDRDSRLIEQMLAILVPQLLHEGYSIGWLQLPAKKLARRDASQLIDQLFDFFTGDTSREYSCFISQSPLPECVQSIPAEPSTFTEEDFWDQPASFEGHSLVVSGNDPFSGFIRKITTVYRQWSLRNPTGDPAVLDDLWNNAYYHTSRKYAKFDFASNVDPVVRAARPNTFMKTIEQMGGDLQEMPAPLLEDLEEPLYFYHVARGVPTIEGSFIMLWTALESLAGLKTEKSDIEMIKDECAPGLALGAIGRRVNSTVQRLRTTGHANQWPFLGPESSEYEEQGLNEWLCWLVDQTDRETDNDAYNTLRVDPLLCQQYRSMNEGWSNLGDLLLTIRRSRKRVEYQLDRLYLTRNCLVHSGQFGHAGAYQWVHLEWYVGKLLALALLSSDAVGRDLGIGARDLLSACLQGQYMATVDYLDRFQREPITAERLRNSGLFRLRALCF